MRRRVAVLAWLVAGALFVAAAMGADDPAVYPVAMFGGFAIATVAAVLRPPGARGCAVAAAALAVFVVGALGALTFLASGDTLERMLAAAAGGLALGTLLAAVRA